MLKTISAIAVAAFAATVFVAFPSLSPQVKAGTPVLMAKSDRVDTRPVRAACGQQAWPNFDQSCLRDEHAATGNVAGNVTSKREVRQVSIDRPAALGSMLAAR